MHLDTVLKLKGVRIMNATTDVVSGANIEKYGP
jgi:hypothetical protein